MARERIPYPEFQVYAKQMERIKRIILKVAREPIPHEPEDIGAQAQKIRRILEAIVNACLAVQMALGDSRRLRRFANLSRAQVLKDRVDGDHYPFVPDPPEELGKPALVVAASVARDEYLTRDRWFTVWNASGALVHEERPGSSRARPRYDTYANDSRIWLQWIVNLLTVHTISTKDLKYSAWVALHDARTNGTLLRVGKLVTPWQSTVQLPDGSVGSLQRRGDGEWQDVTDTTKAAVALMETVGYYTADGYHPVRR